MAPKSKKWKSIGKVAGTLLAATCLTVASGTAARANTYGVIPSLSSPGNSYSFGSPSTTAYGDLTYDFGSPNYFELTGLGAGTFTVGASATETDNLDNGYTVDVNVFNDASIPNLLGSISFQAATNNQTGTSGSFGPDTIPTDGKLVFKVSSPFAEGGTTASLSYKVTVDTTPPPPTSVPEPSTLELLGMGLMGAFGFDLMRRKKNQEEKG